MSYLRAYVGGYDFYGGNLDLPATSDTKWLSHRHCAEFLVAFITGVPHLKGNAPP